MYSTTEPGSAKPIVPPSPSPNHPPPPFLTIPLCYHILLCTVLQNLAQFGPILYPSPTPKHPPLYPCANTYYYVKYYRIWLSSVQYYPLLFLLLHQPPPFLRVVKECTLVLTHTTMYSTTEPGSVRSNTTPSSSHPFFRVVKDRTWLSSVQYYPLLLPPLL